MNKNITFYACISVPANVCFRINCFSQNFPVSSRTLLSGAYIFSHVVHVFRIKATAKFGRIAEIP